MAFLLAVFLLTAVNGSADHQCRTQKNVQGMALKGHTFKTSIVRALYICDFKCDQDERCKSFNYAIQKNICELNNQTKEEKPEYFVPDSERFYMKSLKQTGKIAKMLGKYNGKDSAGTMNAESARRDKTAVAFFFPLRLISPCYARPRECHKVTNPIQ